MDNIFEEVRKMIELGAKFRINFKKKELKVAGENGKYKTIIGNGEFEGNLGLDYMGMAIQDFESDIIRKFQAFYHSVPSERSQSRERHAYFKALPESLLSNEDMLYGVSRELAQFELEYSLLVAAIQKYLYGKWDEKHWFWKPTEGCVIYKEWVI